MQPFFIKPHIVIALNVQTKMLLKKIICKVKKKQFIKLPHVSVFCSVTAVSLI